MWMLYILVCESLICFNVYKLFNWEWDNILWNDIEE